MIVDEYINVSDCHLMNGLIPVVRIMQQSAESEEESLLSGNSFYFKTSESDSIYSLPDGLRWNGTIVAFRIPYNVEQFNYINYLE